VSAAVETMHAWVSHDAETSSSFAAVLPYLPAQLENPSGRQELLEWMFVYIPDCKSSLEPLVAPTLTCMQDRTPAVRSVAEKTLSYIIASVGESKLELVTRDLKPATLRGLQASIGTAIKESKNLVNKSGATPTSDSAPSGDAAAAPVSAPPAVETTSKVIVKSVNSAPPVTSNAEVKSKIPPPSSTGIKKLSLVKGGNGDAAVSEASVSLISVSSTKDIENRRKKNQRQRWVFDEARPEFKTMLAEEMEGVFHAKLIDNLFRGDAKALKESYDALNKAVETNPAAITSNLDLILKWMTIQMVGRESAVSSVYQSEFLHALFLSLQKLNFTMDDYESALFLPFLIEKLGHSKVRFRQSFHETLCLMLSVYSPPKIASSLLDGLSSKNTRARCGALEGLMKIIKDGGWKLVTKKGLATIALMVDHDDKDVRSAAVDCLEVVWKQLDQDGTKFYDLVKSITSKGKGILDEHFKYHATTLASAEAPPAASTGVTNEGVMAESAKKVAPSVSRATPTVKRVAPVGEEAPFDTRSVFNLKVVSLEEEEGHFVPTVPTAMQSVDFSLPETKDIFNFKRLSISSFDLPTPMKPTSGAHGTPSLNEMIISEIPKASPVNAVMSSSPLIPITEPLNKTLTSTTQANEKVFLTFKENMNACIAYFHSIARVGDALTDHPSYSRGIDACSLINYSSEAAFKRVFQPHADESIAIITECFHAVWGCPTEKPEADVVDMKEHMIDSILVSKLTPVSLSFFSFLSTDISPHALKGIFRFFLRALVDHRLKWSLFQQNSERDSLLGILNNCTIQAAR
jgi:hypothetical protein